MRTRFLFFSLSLDFLNFSIPGSRVLWPTFLDRKEKINATRGVGLVLIKATPHVRF